MKYASVCSGVGTCALAWHKIGWTTSWFCEIAAFPAAVLKHRWPSVTNHGDMLDVLARVHALRGRPWASLSEDERALVDIDLLSGATPCQAFSIAGNRLSLEDARGNLTLAFCELADAIDETRPQGLPFIVAENVPGLLSTKDNAFGCFLGKLCGNGAPLVPPAGVHKRGWKRSKLGKPSRFTWPDAGVVHGPTRAVAWRILDSQFFGLAQRRRRVIVVASPRTSGHDPAELLLELSGVRRHSPPSRQARPEAAGAAAPGADAGVAAAFGGNNTSGPIPVAAALNANRGAHNPGDFETGTLLVLRGQTQTGQDFTHPLSTNCGLAQETGEGLGNGAPLVTDIHPVDLANVRVGKDVSGTLTTENDKHNRGQGVLVPDVMGPLLGRSGDQGFRCGADEAAAGMILAEPLPFDTTQITHPRNGSVPLPGDPCHPLASHGHAPTIAFSCKDHGQDAGEIAPTLRGMGVADSHANGGGQVAVNVGLAVRRLTPRECERLQGYPDDHTLVPFGSKDKPAADGPRYRAIGNGWSMNLFLWIGRRIQQSIDTHTSPA